jgi:hypothetical protein
VTITNGYATLAQLRPELNIATNDTTYDSRLESAIAAASRQIDTRCGRRFWQDGSVVAREYHAPDARCLAVDDISTVTGLIVKLDEGDDGTFETTLTITTDFLLFPRNAALEVPVWPYTEIVATGTYWFPSWASGRCGVQVTAKFGWPAVPDDVTRACLIQAAKLFKATEGSSQGFEISSEGFAMRTPRFDPHADALLERYVKSWIG